MPQTPASSYYSYDDHLVPIHSPLLPPSFLYLFDQLEITTATDPVLSLWSPSSISCLDCSMQTPLDYCYLLHLPFSSNFSVFETGHFLVREQAGRSCWQTGLLQQLDCCSPDCCLIDSLTNLPSLLIHVYFQPPGHRCPYPESSRHH